MATIWLLVRTEVRSRWSTLAGLSIIVAIVVALVLAAVVGARRTSTTVDRFRARSGATDAQVQMDTAEHGVAASDAFAALPYVDEAATRYLVNGFPAEGDEATPDFAVMSDPDGRYGVTVDRMRMLSGRMPASDSTDEIALTEHAADLLDRRVGDHLHVQTFATTDLEAIGSGTAFPGFNGPALDLVVVGIGRLPGELQGDVVRNSIYAFAAPRFIAAHPGVGAWPPAVMLRLHDPAHDQTRLADDANAIISGIVGSDAVGPPDIVTADDQYLTTTQHTVDDMSTGLMVFAIVAAIAGLAIVTQVLSRQVSTASAPGPVLLAMGFDRRHRAVALALPSILACAVGIGLGIAAAVALSPLLPIGLARRAETRPGLWVDPWSLGLGAALAAAVLAGWALLTSWRSQRLLIDDRGPRRRSSAAADRLARWGARPPTVIGVRYAFESGGRPTIPVRAALISTAIAVTGVVGAGVVATSLDSLLRDGARWGWNWSTMPDLFGESEPPPELQTDDRITAVGQLRQTSVVLGEQRLGGFSMEPVKGDVNFTVAAGRLPSTTSEVALGRDTSKELGAPVGGTVTAVAADGTSSIDLDVVGLVVLPPTQYPSPATGAVLTPDGLAALANDNVDESLVLRYRKGIDATELEQQLTTDDGMSFPIFARAQAPGSVKDIAQGRGIAVALAGFFTVLGLGGLLHTITVSCRRRRGEFVILRTLGFRRRQVITTAVAQSLAIAVLGLVIGIPAGVIVGRAVWSGLAGDLGVIDPASTPWVLLVLVVPVTVAIAALVAWPPGYRAARARPIDNLNDMRAAR